MVQRAGLMAAHQGVLLVARLVDQMEVLTVGLKEVCSEVPTGGPLVLKEEMMELECLMEPV